MLVRLKGRCTFSSLVQFEEILADINHRPPTRFEIELSELEYIDSSGVGMLLMLQEACERRQSHLILCNPPIQVMNVMRLTKLDQLFTIEGMP